MRRFCQIALATFWLIQCWFCARLSDDLDRDKRLIERLSAENKKLSDEKLGRELGLWEVYEVNPGRIVICTCSKPAGRQQNFSVFKVNGTNYVNICTTNQVAYEEFE